MRLGYHTGYWSAGPPPGAQEAVLGAEQLGFDSVWTAEAYGSDALTPLAWWGARTLAHPARHRDRADLGPHADRDGDGGPHARPPLRRPVRARPRRLRPAGGGGLVRPAVPASRSPAPASTCRSSGRCWPARRPSRSTASSTGSPCPPTRGPGWARRCARPCTRCGPTCRSTWPPRARATSRCRRRSPTAGCRCSTRRAWTASTGRSSPRGSPSARRAQRRRGLRGRRDGARRARRRRRVRRRQRPAVHRALRGRHGRQGRQLPPRRARPARVRRGVRRDPGALPRRRPRARDRRRAARAGPGHRSGRHRRGHPGPAARVGGRPPSRRCWSRPTRARSRRSRTRCAHRPDRGMDDDYAEAVLDLVAADPAGPRDDVRD